jgi:methionyl-tRNA formyltransferase
MRIVMLGTGTFAEPTFAAILAAFPGDVVGLVTQPDRDTGRRSGGTRQTGAGMATLAEAAGVPVVRPECINTPEGLAAFAAFAPDVAVVAAYGQILKPAVIATPRSLMFNVHASLLPKYRGAAPVAHAIWSGETETGVTIIRVAPGLDAGEMLAAEAITIAPGETAGELEARLAPIGARLAVETLQRLHRGPIVGTPQDPALVSRAPKLTKEMGAIDWAQPAARVCRQIAAMQPWPTAYSFYHRPGKEPLRVIVSKAVPADRSFESLSPGAAFSHEGRLFVVGFGGVVELHELQPAGKKRMPAAEFLRGYPTGPGVQFGPERAT